MSQAHYTVKNTPGILAVCFRTLLMAINLSSEKVCKAMLAHSHLYNYWRNKIKGMVQYNNLGEFKGPQDVYHVDHDQAQNA